MGQILKLRNYPPVDNHTVTAPNADTLYTTAWVDVCPSRGSSVFPTWATVITCCPC